MLSIRMTRVGAKKKPYFRVVVSEARSGLYGDIVENLGTYNPRSKPAQVNVDKSRIEHWLKRGARPSSSVRTLIARHLSRDLTPVEATEASGTGGQGAAEASGRSEA
jgi:small subunit ribosomal protein S16